MKKTNFAQLNMFVKIAETGNLSNAARDLGLTPSSVSKGLAQLEDVFGTALVNRTTRSVTLTEAGKLVYEKASHLLNEAENIIESVRQFSDPTVGTLKLTCSLALGCSWLQPIIAAYQKKNPHVNFDIHLDDRLINLHEEEFDLALRVTNQVESSFYFADRIRTIHWHYYASQKYISAEPPIKSPENLLYHRCLVYPRMMDDGKWSFIQKDTGTVNRLVVPTHISSNSSLFLLQSVLMNEGVACLPDYLVRAYLNNGRLQQVLCDFESGVSHILYAVSIRRKQNNPILQSFTDFLHLY
ncbi:LysR family transcriptional regulator, partial [Citrobacter sp. Igbk 14]|uniref:LysR family transcriptional regulator n=1 Tax=Citrobacter sp. Igbk 14 TaxID=2963960 RepID=UPI0023021ACD